tara:strand:+ start:75 stop:218 length:144 start_codon:yes stop_codon:yes gene_type:complete
VPIVTNVKSPLDSAGKVDPDATVKEVAPLDMPLAKVDAALFVILIAM